jgi:hypothetical protein
MVKVFGIRHHGPGSAKALGKALLAFNPDCILLEAPEEMESLFPFLMDKKAVLPIAGLIYESKDISKAVYFPMAGFSPEYLVIQFAFSRSIPLVAMDLPVGMYAGSEGKMEDPMSELALLAGYTDSERWWEVYFEQQAGGEEIFNILSEMMRNLRQFTSPSNAKREAWMRIKIRKALSEGYQKVAVVCGAWHIPALEDYAIFKEREDKKILKGISKVKCEACLVPWSYEQLAFSSGYGAGVISPFWYELLFLYPTKPTIYWMIRAARLLRRKDLDASSAQVREAVQLAESLAGLRNLAIPGLDELKDAVLTVLCNGQTLVFQSIEKDIIIGDRIGKIPDNVPVLPIQQDLMAQIKLFRLSAAFNSTESTVRELDLRKELHRQISVLLHRLLILEIPWGRKLKESIYARGSFSEDWSLKWRPGHFIKLIQAGRFGRTIEEATIQKSIQIIEADNDFVLLASFTDKIIKAGIPDLVPKLLHKLQQLGANSEDIEARMQVVCHLIPVRRYGDARKTDQSVMDWLLMDLIPRISVGIIKLVDGIDSDYAKRIFLLVKELHHLLPLLENKELTGVWEDALNKLIYRDRTAPMIRGGCLRILAESGKKKSEEVAIRISFELSEANEEENAALWLEGFLWGPAQYLIYNPELLEVFDGWINKLGEKEFERKLPMLRRIFSRYSGIEKRKLFKLISLENQVVEEEIKYNEERKEKVLENLFFLKANKKIIDP